MSTPSNRTLPPTPPPPVGSSRITESAVIVLPHPDSPTSPSVSPARTLSSTPSTACTVERLSRMSVRSPLISSNGGPSPPTADASRGRHSVASPMAPSPPLQPDLEGVAERVAHEVESDGHQDDRDPWWVEQPPVAAVDVVGGRREHPAPVGVWRLDPEAEVAQEGQGDDGVRHGEAREHHDGSDRVGGDVPDDG